MDGGSDTRSASALSDKTPSFLSDCTDALQNEGYNIKCESISGSFLEISGKQQDKYQVGDALKRIDKEPLPAGKDGKWTIQTRCSHGLANRDEEISKLKHTLLQRDSEISLKTQEYGNFPKLKILSE